MQIKTNNTFLKADNTVEGQNVEILDSGTEKEFENKDGTKKTVYNFRVLTDKDEELFYTPNNTTLKAFVKAWGADSMAWINQRFKVTHVRMMIQGQPKMVIVGEPYTYQAPPTPPTTTEETVQ